MSKVLVYDIEKTLPLYSINKGKSILLKHESEHQIDYYYTNFKEELEEINKDLIIKYGETNEEEFLSDWVTKRLKLGKFGEKIAKEFLLENYNKVIDLTQNKDYMGYDLKVVLKDKVLGFEIKTTKKSNSFHISYNELKVANEMQENYNIFIIKEDIENNKVSGYIINNPIKVFSINFKELTKLKKHNNAFIIPRSFIIELNEDFIDILKTDEIDLTSYANRLKIKNK